MRLTNAKHHNATHGKGRDGVLPIKLLNPGTSNVIFKGSEANVYEWEDSYELLGAADDTHQDT